MSKLDFLSRFKPGTFSNDKVHPLIDAALDHRNYSVREAAARNPNATKEHLDKALDSKQHYLVREAAAKHPNATKEHLEKALTDESSDVRSAAANHPNATKEHLEKALTDESSDVRSAAATNLYSNK